MLHHFVVDAAIFEIPLHRRCNRHGSPPRWVAAIAPAGCSFRSPPSRGGPAKRPADNASECYDRSISAAIESTCDVNRYLAIDCSFERFNSASCKGDERPTSDNPDLA